MVQPISDVVETKRAKFEAAQIRLQLKNFCLQNKVLYFDLTGDFSETFFNQNFQNLDPNKKLMVLVKMHDLLPGTKDRWNKIDVALELAGKKLLVVTDSFVDLFGFKNIQFLQHDCVIGLKHFMIDPAFFKSYSLNSKPSRLFNCFIHRVEPVRQSWFYFLHNLELIDQGYVSFLCYNHADLTQTALERFDQNHLNGQLDQLDHFNKAYQELRPLIPFKNFDENGQLWDKICDSKYSLCLDTFSTIDDTLTYFVSERVSRDLMLPSIDLLFMQKGTLEKLKSIGMILFSSDFDIDHLPWQQRQQRLLEILKQDQITYDPVKLLEIAQQNYETLKSLYSTRPKFIDNVHNILSQQKVE